MSDIASFNNLPLLSVIFYSTQSLYTDVCCFIYCQAIFWRMDEGTAFSLMIWNKILSIPYLPFCLARTLDGASLSSLLQDKLFSIQFNRCGLGILWLSLDQVQEVEELYVH